MNGVITVVKGIDEASGVVVRNNIAEPVTADDIFAGIENNADFGGHKFTRANENEGFIYDPETKEIEWSYRISSRYMRADEVRVADFLNKCLREQNSEYYKACIDTVFVTGWSVYRDEKGLHTVAKN